MREKPRNAGQDIGSRSSKKEDQPIKKPASQKKKQEIKPKVDSDLEEDEF